MTAKNYPFEITIYKDNKFYGTAYTINLKRAIKTAEEEIKYGADYAIVENSDTKVKRLVRKVNGNFESNIVK